MNNKKTNYAKNHAKSKKNTLRGKQSNFKLSPKSVGITAIIVLAIVVLARILLTLLPSYKIDMGGYTYWSNYLARNGFQGFYQDKGLHIVYGPVYMYALFITGKLNSFLSLGSLGHEFFVKIWAVLSDLIGGYLIFLIGRKYKKDLLGLLIGAMYALNPAIFFNSSIWGQFDSIPATMMLGVIYLFNLRKNVFAITLYAIAVLTKPQSAVLAPLVLVLFYKDYLVNIFKHFSLKTLGTFIKKIFTEFPLIKTLQAAAGGIISYIITVMPFYAPDPELSLSKVRWIPRFLMPVVDFFYWVPAHYLKSSTDYPYGTANGFNLWTILGGQAVDDSNPFFILSYKTWGLILFFVVAIITIWALMKKKNSVLMLYTAAYLLTFAAFMFGTRMHERYLLPAIIFLMVGILWDSRLWIPTILISLCHLGNQWYMYDLAKKDMYWVDRYDKVAMYIAIATLMVLLYSAYYMIRLALKKPNNVLKSSEEVAN